MKKSNLLVFNLTKKQMYGIFIYYGVILVASIVTSAFLLMGFGGTLSQDKLMIKTIMSSLAVSSMLCSVQYIKRLYKACITERISECQDYKKKFGNVIYFISRPLFSFVFVLVMIFSILSGMFIVTGSLDYIINEKFLYLCVMCSSFIGFSVGSILDKYEEISHRKIENIK